MIQLLLNKAFPSDVLKKIKAKKTQNTCKKPRFLKKLDVWAQFTMPMLNCFKIFANIVGFRCYNCQIFLEGHRNGPVFGQDFRLVMRTFLFKTLG